MSNVYKTLKISAILLMVFALLANLLFWIYPEFYISLKTGYAIESISKLRELHNAPGDAVNEYRKICANLNSENILIAYRNLKNWAWLLAEISLIIGLLFLVINGKVLSNKYKYGILAILFVPFAIYFWTSSSELELVFDDCMSYIN